MTQIHPLTVRYAAKPSAAPTGTEYWLRMEQIKGDDRATTADVARVVDALYSIDPCSEPEETTAQAEPVVPTAEQFLQTAAPILDLAECARRRSGEYTARLKIVYSHPNDPQEKYKLTVTVGEIRSISRVTEDITLTLNVKEVSSIILDYPVSQLPGKDWPGSAKWLGSVYNETEGAIPPPDITGDGNILAWAGPCTGTILVKVSTVYDVAAIVVPGIPLYATSPVGKSQDSRARIFYHYQVYEADITMVDEDASADQQTVAEICGYASFSGDGDGTDGYSVGSSASADTSSDAREPESEEGPPMGCLSPAEYLDDQDFYADICCHPQPMSLMLPDCLVYATPRPIRGINQDVIDRLQREYRGQIDFIAVGPGPDGCGRTIVTQNVSKQPCCDVIPAIIPNPDNPTTVERGSSTVLAVTGGEPILHWTIQGGTFSGGFTSIDSAVRFQDVFANCGYLRVEISDKCSFASINLSVTGGMDVNIPQADRIVAPGGTIAIEHDGGLAPLIWSSDKLISLGGGVFSAPLDFCGTAQIGVRDMCGATATCGVRSTDGQWIDITSAITDKTGFCHGVDSSGVTNYYTGYWVIDINGTTSGLFIWTRMYVGKTGVHPFVGVCPGNDLGSLLNACRFLYQGLNAYISNGACCFIQSNGLEYCSDVGEQIYQVLEWQCHE